ncbi:hypothetical protein BB560_001277 [Smittium megazygosporum]|uniref:Uncharacterized protein n=1 Tax=Smittium megazygosporum TaxID=133381 RepID=A0A2T9ZI39_9FUNG|nr:hypothetical protein BB560_001277 [Smittium megazygosporum]
MSALGHIPPLNYNINIPSVPKSRPSTDYTKNPSSKTIPYLKPPTPIFTTNSSLFPKAAQYSKNDFRSRLVVKPPTLANSVNATTAILEKNPTIPRRGRSSSLYDSNTSEKNPLISNRTKKDISRSRSNSLSKAQYLSSSTQDSPPISAHPQNDHIEFVDRPERTSSKLLPLHTYTHSSGNTERQKCYKQLSSAKPVVSNKKYKNLTSETPEYAISSKFKLRSQNDLLKQKNSHLEKTNKTLERQLKLQLELINNLETLNNKVVECSASLIKTKQELMYQNKEYLIKIAALEQSLFENNL